MSQNVATSAMTRPITSDALLHARRVTEDPSINDLERKSHRLKSVTLGLLPLVAGVALIGFVVYGNFLPDAHPDTHSGNPELRDFVNNLERWGVSLVMLAVAGLFLHMSNMSDAVKARANKAVKNGIHGARHTAQKLGTEVVPVLTTAHVDARIKIDIALRSKLEELKLGWRQGDADRIGALLFLDLNREPVIASLISDRGMVTSEDVEAALLESESNAIAPVRNGWL